MRAAFEPDLVAPGTAYLGQYPHEHPILERFGAVFAT